jgi:uncharacterized protein YfkK (UPF0435 family)
MEQNIESASGKQLVRAVERLSPAELDAFADRLPHNVIKLSSLK